MYDTLIIGGGLSGLMNAYILAKEGQKVIILEKNPIIGGSIQNFKRNGVTFDTGAHYIGGLGKGQNLHTYFRYFNLRDTLNLKKLDSEAFDIINIQDKKYKYAEGFNNFEETLLESFPNDKKAISEYGEMLNRTSKQFPLFNPNVEVESIDISSISTNAMSYIKSITQNSELQNVLAGTNLLYLGKPEKTPLYMHALINYGYIESAWRVIGGSGKIADQLKKSLLEFGAEIYTNETVEKIELDGKKIKAVKTESGKSFSAKTIISTIYPSLTFKMLDTKLIRKAYRKRVDNLENTKGMFSLYVIFKENEFPYINANNYCYNKKDVWDGINYKENEFGSTFFMMTPPVSQNDKYATSAVILTAMHYTEVEKWKGTNVENRGNEYKELKEKRAEELIDSIEKFFPNFRQKIKKYYTSTPLTYENYTATKEGSAYGILKDSENPYESMILPATKIENLFLAGQNINMHGVHGITVGAVITCSYILGKEYLMKEIKKYNEK